MSLVWNRERPAGEIASHFSLTRPAVSQHLTVLLQSGLVSVRRVGTRRLYQVDLEEVARLRSVLDAFWEGPLYRLKSAAERAKRMKKEKR
jgi:DNA-binding transcriptional ArsR family regulator